MAAAAGFYPDPDPSAPAGRQRWWDGSAWTATVRAADPPSSPPPPPPPPPSPPAYPSVPVVATMPPLPPWEQQPYAYQPQAQAAAYRYEQRAYPPSMGEIANPSRDLARERSMSGIVYLTVLGFAALFAAVVILEVTHARHVSQVAASFKAIHGFGPDALTLDQLDGNNRFIAIIACVYLLQALASIPFLTWWHRAATLAQRLHYPAKLGPGMGVGGWFIPVCNLWFPYQSARDMLPPGHTGRGRVGAWWTIHISFGIVVGFGQAIASGFASSGHYSAVGAVIQAIIDLALIVGWVVAFRRMQQAIEANHEGAINQINARATSVAQ